MRRLQYIPIADLSAAERTQGSGMAAALRRNGVEPIVVLMPSSASAARRYRQEKARFYKQNEAARKRRLEQV